MATICITISLTIFCVLCGVHPNLMAVMFAILWHAYVDEKKG